MSVQNLLRANEYAKKILKEQQFKGSLFVVPEINFNIS